MRKITNNECELITRVHYKAVLPCCKVAPGYHSMFCLDWSGQTEQSVYRIRYVPDQPGDPPLRCMLPCIHIHQLLQCTYKSMSYTQLKSYDTVAYHANCMLVSLSKRTTCGVIPSHMSMIIIITKIKRASMKIDDLFYQNQDINIKKQWGLLVYLLHLRSWWGANGNNKQKFNLTL